MQTKKIRVSSGVNQLDQLLGGLFIGDNVIWYDDAGSLAEVFTLNFIQESLNQNKPLIYVSFDRSPKSLLENIGSLTENQNLTILDCFTHGKGDGSEIFQKFYEKNGAQWPYQIVKVTEPGKPDKVMDAIYSLHQTMKGDVRFVFESLTGMQNLWGGESPLVKFYTHSCPRLYELDTIAYWIIEKGAHSNRLKAQINQIAQVAIELSIKRGKSTLSILKADKRKPDILNKPCKYWTDEYNVNFESKHLARGKIDLGLRLKELRSKRGLSQKELAEFVGVTPSTISQIETDLIYPSLPALFRIAEALSVQVSAFFQEKADAANRMVFSGEGLPAAFPDMPKGSIRGRLLSPLDFEGKIEPYLIEIPAEKKLPSHFFTHKGVEMGYVLSGKLHTVIKNTVHKLRTGDILYLSSDVPSQWKNPGPGTAKLLWLKMK